MPKSPFCRVGARYRDTLDKIELVTDADADADGRIAVTWPAPGMYYLSTSVSTSDRSQRNVARPTRPRWKCCHSD